MEYENFYENFEEAQRRLLQTIVAYDNEPGRIIAICNRKDKPFGVYFLPLNVEKETMLKSIPVDRFLHGTQEQADALDAFIAEHKGLLCKDINAKGFNNFRPFPLGMMNLNGSTYFLERQPQRQREQGLTKTHVFFTKIQFDEGPSKSGTWMTYLGGKELYDCVVGHHPSFTETARNLRNPTISNSAAAFDRNMALLRGPMGLLFLVYKTEVVGFIPEDKEGCVELSKNFSYLREVMESSRHFRSVTIR